MTPTQPTQTARDEAAYIGIYLAKLFAILGMYALDRWTFIHAWQASAQWATGGAVVVALTVLILNERGR